MTDKHAGYIVTLDQDIREDDGEAIINALRMVRGVVSVQPITSTAEQQVAAQRRDIAWRKALVNLDP